jgi:polyisoprenyl-phosphate glycosyltransferase
MSEEEIELSVVVPVYRCEECLEVLHRRVVASMSTLTDAFEIVFVDDRSPDGSRAVLSNLAARDPAVRVLRLSRNFGQQAAITAGLSRSRGRWTVVMDCDLQDPPELIPRLYAKAQEGYDVVLARRAQRSHSPLRLFAAKLYFKAIRLFLGVEISGDYGAFSILSAKARTAFLSVPDADRHYIPILFWIGFERADVEFEHGRRYAGKSSYSFGSLVSLAVQGVFFQTTTLLRWVIYAGFAIAAAGMLLAALLVASRFFYHPYPGWTSLIVLLLVIGGFVILSTGVTGLYVGRIFKQVKGRPLFIVDAEESVESHAQQPTSTRSE